MPAFAGMTSDMYKQKNTGVLLRSGVFILCPDFHRAIIGMANSQNS
jgi:hypothetical protein